MKPDISKFSAWTSRLGPARPITFECGLPKFEKYRKLGCTPSNESSRGERCCSGCGG